MKTQKAFLLFGGLGVAAVAASPIPSVSFSVSEDFNPAPSINYNGTDDANLTLFDSQIADYVSQSPIDYQIMEPANPVDFGYAPPPVIDYGASNLDAFLAVIRKGESDDNYTALVGGGNFRSFADHPAVTGEFKGIPTRDGTNYTTAAGAYQIVRKTWLGLGGKTKYGSFDPQAQTMAAIDLIKGRGAYQDVLNGRIEIAISKLRKEWEFLIMPKWKPATVIAEYQREGGTLS